MWVKNAQKLCAALALGTTMAVIASPKPALANFESYWDCIDGLGPHPFCFQYLDWDNESSDNSVSSPTGDESEQSISEGESEVISESPDPSVSSPIGDISGVGSAEDAAEVVSIPEPSLILGFITVGGLMLGSRKKAKA
jgi:hypothetical protein